MESEKEEISSLHSVFNMPYAKKVQTCSSFIAAFLLVVVSIERIDGAPDGAPTAACATMTPGHGFDPQPISSSPFRTEISAGEYVLMDETVRLELRSKNGISSFKGFLVMAFDMNNSTQPIGTFKLPSDGKLMDCIGGVMNAATHKFNNDKQLATVDWIPPKNYMGTVIFRTTFVQNVGTYWVKTESIAVSFVMEIPKPTTVPTVSTTPSNSASQLSSTLVVLVLASLLAFLKV